MSVIGHLLYGTSVSVMPTVRITASVCHAQGVTGVLGLMLAGIAWDDSRAVVST